MRAARPASIRFRITLVSSVVAALVLTVTAIVILTVQRDQLMENLDAGLEQRADTVQAGLELAESGPLAVAGDTDRFVQLATRDGSVVASSPNVAGMGPAVDPASGETFHTVSNLEIEDDEYRVLVRYIGDNRALLVAENIDDVNDAERNLGLTLLVAVPLVVAVLGVLTWWLVGRTLAPVDRIRAEVNEIRAGALDRRVQRPATDDEIADLVETMNDMLDRVEDATSRQQRFVADASHELRSPLARMRTELEVELADPDVASPDVLASVLEEVMGLQVLIDDLLHLARSDAGAEELQRVPVDLDDIVLHEARKLRETSTHEVDTTGVSAAHLEGDPAQLLRMVRNLTDNAARHATGRVELRLGEIDGAIRLEIGDDGPGASAADFERIFDRFTRADASRSTATGGSGLGLAIVRDVVERHGGAVTVSPRAPTGLVFTAELPMTAAAPHAGPKGSER